MIGVIECGNNYMCLPWLLYFPFVFVYLHGGEKQHFLEGRGRRKGHKGAEQSHGRGEKMRDRESGRKL